MTAKHFESKVVAAGAKHLYVPLPFDPAALWGDRDRYHVTGTVAGRRFRGVLEQRSGAYVLPLGSHWLRELIVKAGDAVAVVMDIEGPPRDALADDIRTALDAVPQAARFFDALAQFYRRGYLRWIDATKRSPDERARRIAEMVRLCQAGRKQK